eukprot:Unigene6193_Nuclearia_a/m.19053 Unigene6193_Nuclearia_a/g.19053  ORF Unigene6193_Nuclearia_a/g.19053 Unigene6193_Nuclearia_a/m.19053 type:complete len:499 (+) Unigene6193_Nuclearia_a:1065-2561(+)
MEREDVVGHLLLGRVAGHLRVPPVDVVADDDVLRVVVREPRARAHDRPAKPARVDLAIVVEHKHSREGVAVHVRVERAQLLAQQARQHGDRALHHVHRRRTHARLLVERAALGHKVAHVRDVHAHLPFAVRQVLDVQGVVEVARRRRVDAEHALVAHVAASRDLLRCRAPGRRRQARDHLGAELVKVHLVLEEDAGRLGLDVADRAELAHHVPKGVLRRLGPDRVELHQQQLALERFQRNVGRLAQHDRREARVLRLEEAHAARGCLARGGLLARRVGLRAALLVHHQLAGQQHVLVLGQDGDDDALGLERALRRQKLLGVGSLGVLHEHRHGLGLVVTGAGAALVRVDVLPRLVVVDTTSHACARRIGRQRRAWGVHERRRLACLGLGLGLLRRRVARLALGNLAPGDLGTALALLARLHDLEHDRVAVKRPIACPDAVDKDVVGAPVHLTKRLLAVARVDTQFARDKPGRADGLGRELLGRQMRLVGRLGGARRRA